MGTASFSGSSGKLPGESFEWNGSVPPNDALEETGAAISRIVYARLFGIIGTTFGAGDGVNTFNLPDSRRRTAVGAGGAGTGTLGNAVGNTGGAESVALVEANNGPHTHQGPHHGSGGGAVNPAFTGTQATNTRLTTSSSGSGTPHNNLPPSIVKMKCIKY